MKNLKKNKELFNQKYGNYKKPETTSELIKNIYKQIAEILVKHSSLIWKGDFTRADKYDIFFHARSLRIYELKKLLF